MKPGTLYAVLWDYGQLVETFDARRQELGLSHVEWNERAKLSTGFTSKACGPAQTAKFGHVSLFKAARQIGLRLTVEIDPHATQTILADRVPRDNKAVRSRNYSRSAAMRHRQRVHRELASMGARALNAMLTPEQRSANGRKGALIRWAAAASAPVSARSASESAPCAPTNNLGVAAPKRRARPRSPWPTA